MINKKEWFGTEMELDVEGQHNSLKLIHPEILDDLGSDHTDAQWFKNAGLGLFLHWSISSVDGRMDVSWGMLSRGKYYPKGTTIEEIEKMEEQEVIDDNFKMRPSKYFSLAKDFNAKNYDADKWMEMAKKAGFQYAVLTTMHCDGFKLWPSKYGDFSTKDFLNGRDLVREFADACRKHGLKVGFYFTPTDWHFNKDHMSFMHYKVKEKNPDLPFVDEDFIEREMPSEEEMAKQKKIHGIQHRNQLHELLTNYGKIDILWFDGGAMKGEAYPLEEIYKLQPGVVVTIRMHGYGDFRNCEVKFAEQKPKGWWEYCTIWSKRQAWAYTNNPVYRPTADILAELIKTKNWGGNYLLNIGPMADGQFPETAIKGLNELADWMSIHKESVIGSYPLLAGESANVYATAKDNARYLFMLPDLQKTVELKGVRKPKRVYLMSSGKDLDYSFKEDSINIEINKIPDLSKVEVIKIEL